LANKSGFVTLLIIIAVLTMSVAMLAGYIFVFGGMPQQDQIISGNIDAIRRPSDKELGTKKLYEENQYFVLKNDNSSKQSFIRVGVDVRYFKSVKGIKNCEEKINNFDGEIKELIGTYFQELSIEQVKNLEFKIKAKAELKTQINDLLNSSENIYNEIVYDVVFYDWFYQ